MNTENCKTDIINRALTLLREKEIVDASINPETDTEKLVNKWFDTAKQEAIIDINPPFARTRKVLLPIEAVDPATLKKVEDPEKINPLYKYQIPADCLRIFDIDYDNTLIEGNFLYCNETTNYLIKYLTSNSELYIRENKFNIALSYILAYYICADLTNNDQKIQLFLELKNQKISEARTFYLRESGIKIIKNYEWKKRRL